ncbi:LRR domain containing protein [Trema orientale]|uniref:LRR domain containing protein n=1 Tax=Trema orientale TaxID=63057 RepID=A0A2P5EH32_TREOI|nr:LRR domain containing protein [Trema orientale]
MLRIVILLLLTAGELVRQGGADNDQLVASCLESDREALLDFKNGLEGPENPMLLTWRGSNCCQWWGISCENGTGAVTHVDLHNPHPEAVDGDSSSRYGFWNLNGEIRRSLMELKSLKYLDLSSNTFNGISIPEFLGSLQNLQYLNLSRAGFSGPIPSNLGNISSLQYLDLSLNHNINSEIPDSLVNVSSLATIDISNSGLHGRIPLGLGNLPNLEILRLTRNNLDASSSQFLSERWEKIQILDLSFNSIHGKLPDSFGNMTSLTYLDLSNNNFQGGIPSSIGRLCNLELFSISKNNLTGTLPESLDEETRNCVSRSPFSSLRYLDLSNNKLRGTLPKWLGQLENLIELSLVDNLLTGPIPDSLHLLQKLRTFDLSQNRLNGTLPTSIGQLPSLYFIDVSSNYLTGVVNETHFLKHTELRFLDLSLNSLILDMGSNWVPPFQTSVLDMSSCHLNSPFPAWLKSQESIVYLGFSNASISGSIPNWFWEISQYALSLNISFNKLEGQLPNPWKLNNAFQSVDFSHNLFEGPLPLPVGMTLTTLDLSHNKFSGSIPKNISDYLPILVFLSLAENQIKGEIPTSIGYMDRLQVIDLSSNNLTGTIPPNIGNFSSLVALDLSKNSLSGTIPSKLGQPSDLRTLHLSENLLSGQIPSSFRNLSRLEMLDLERNMLVGRIPHWIGEGLENLRILSLRSNAFFGELPSTLSNLSSLHVLDLADNQLNGTVPAIFGDFKGMTQVQNKLQYLLYENYDGVNMMVNSEGLVYTRSLSGNKFYQENMVVNTKGQRLLYTKTLSLVISLDLSRNNLSGDFPVELTKLLGLVVLDLSRNHISGHIPANISKLGQLSSLDLSSHLTTFDSSSFAGNPGLCGAPLDVRCADDNDNDDDDDDDDLNKEWFVKDGFIDNWFYLSVGLGFVAGLIVPFLIMSVRKSWSIAYFGLVDEVAEKLWFLKHETAKHTRYRRRRHNRAV